MALATKFVARQVPKAKSGAERAKAYRERKKAEASAPPSAEHLIPPDFVPPADYAEAPTPTAAPVSRPPAASIALMVAPPGSPLSATQNGWFARSLGATETAGWLFSGRWHGRRIWPPLRCLPAQRRHGRPASRAPR